MTISFQVQLSRIDHDPDPSSGGNLGGMLKWLVLSILLLISTRASLGQERPSTADSEVRETLARFIQAFDYLDWNSFRAFFADNATVFYPRAFLERANGRAEFEKTFELVFGQIRAGRSTGPYMNIQPKDLRIQLFDNVAIATFHLDDRTGYINRRTIVLHRAAHGWTIVHLHASEVSVETK